jgi:hypothetical protein|tara:strand:- start:1064 stop:1363 length:300 start_codon:yes stop_codon:yes gene_type:complete
MVNLSKVEKYYIESHRDLKPHKISKSMRNAVTEEVVDKYLKILPPKEKSVTTSGDLMDRDEDKGVAIMTGAASEHADAFRDKEAEKALADNADRIHKIK